jgi:hypothetical protein
VAIIISKKGLGTTTVVEKTNFEKELILQEYIYKHPEVRIDASCSRCFRGFTAGMAGSSFAVDVTGGGIECRIQRERSVSVVLKSVTFGASWRERQDGIKTIQGLNGGLLIDAEYSRVLGRIQIEAEDVGRFSFELGIIAGHVAFEAVRFQAGLLPNPMPASLLTPSAVASLRQLQCVDPDPSLGFLLVADRMRARRAGVPS